MNTPETPEPVLPEFYANTVQVQAAAFEFEIQHLLYDLRQQLKGGLTVRLSPQTAWTLSRVLRQQVDQYEEIYGAIPLPAEVRKSLGG